MIGSLPGRKGEVAGENADEVKWSDLPLCPLLIGIGFFLLELCWQRETWHPSALDQYKLLAYANNKVVNMIGGHNAKTQITAADQLPPGL